MRFVWPWMLLTLFVLPALVSAYRELLDRRAVRRAELASLGLVAPAATTSRRRHVAPALFLGAMTLLLLALARPQATIAEPRREGTVVLAFDTSRSMAATDLSPTRMEAAKAAARSFVKKQPDSIRVGVVAFGESGLITQRPTVDRTEVLAAIDRLTPSGGTALARGIQTSLSAVAGKTVQLDAQGSSPELTGPDLGYYGSASVILLSDGENTGGPDPTEAAGLASTAGVKIYPIGLGSPEGSVLQIDGFQIATALDEPMLRQIASTTDGRYFAAADERALSQVYDSIDLSWTVRGEQVEVTGGLAALAALLLVIGTGLSLAWYGRVI
jgi:Ca-activated chloride channel family protein